MVEGPGTGPAIRIRGFIKRYGRNEAVRGVDLTAERGQLYGIIGPDGAGKSSLMKAVAGVLAHNGGDVEVLGVTVDSELSAESVKARIGFMPQGLGLNLYPDLSVDENIDFFGHIRLVGKDLIEERKKTLLAVTRLERFRNRPMKQLSGGMKQKLGLVCTLIHSPELIILDEPTTGVDPVSRRDFWTILSELVHEQGITALVSTAYMDEASRFHRMSLLYNGEVLAEGTPDTIQSLVPGRLFMIRATPRGEALSLLRPHYPGARQQGGWIRVFVRGAESEGAGQRIGELMSSLKVDRIVETDPDLEDVFILLLEKDGHAGEGTAAAGLTAGNVKDPTDDHAAIEARDLVRYFGEFCAVDGVCFRVPYGEIFGLLGANGAGKTTVIKMLTGIIRPTAGQCRVAGTDMRYAGRDVRERIGYMSQAFSLYLDLTVVENITLYAGIYSLTRQETRDRTAWIIAQAGLGGHGNDLAGSLPMGLRQRLALGCALVHRPRVLFLDEPTSGVDPVGRRLFWDILYGLSRDEGVAILVTTHYMSEAEYCDRLALMHGGKLIADATPEALKRDVETVAGQIIEIAADRPESALKTLKKSGFGTPSFFGRKLHVLSLDPGIDGVRATEVLTREGIRVSSVNTLPLSMEDVFVYRIESMEQEAVEAEAQG